MDQFWTNVALVGFGGFAVGVGLVVGLFTIKWLRRILGEEEDEKGP